MKHNLFQEVVLLVTADREDVLVLQIEGLARKVRVSAGSVHKQPVHPADNEQTVTCLEAGIYLLCSKTCKW